MDCHLDEEHLQIFSKNFQDNLQVAISMHVDSFVSSMVEYSRSCSREILTEKGAELVRSNADLIEARTSLENAVGQSALICIMQSALKLSTAIVTANHMENGMSLK
ncbi:uncharacterized protein LOC113211283 [Frankliniella occidentalis]|uniref:Uncharacterized protein LOC113211283 n=1 Tax=Frankliniella occidentalis TaxID=133901 RepID=A0A6J1SWY9_FRAOC|nr:uncharacterized protein LOC113211283 [Frankliniella occidentalis]